MPFPENARNRRVLVLALILVGSVAVVATLKLPGVFIAALLIAAALLMLHTRPDASEQAALRSSIRLSAEDIEDVLAEYEDFRSSEAAEKIADRTLYRPALLDLDCSDPTIEAFHYEISGARRFLRRLNLRVNAEEVSTNELESLLKVTDERARELKETWLSARRAAFALGPKYEKNEVKKSRPAPPSPRRASVRGRGRRRAQRLSAHRSLRAPRATRPKARSRR